MRYIFLPLIIFVLAGCIEWKTEFRVRYYGNGATEGSSPVDSNIYKQGDSVRILGKGNLKKGDDEFLGWAFSGFTYQPEDYITISYEDIVFRAIWDGTRFSYIDTGNDEVTITKYNEEYSFSITIPDTIRGKTVTAIDDSVFSRIGISVVNLNNSLKRIGIRAFSTNYLSQISIPDSVESIGLGAFQNNYLASVVIGSGINAIEPLTFGDNVLKEIAIPENVKSIGEGAFKGNDIDYIKIGADVDIKSDNAMGKYGASFKAYYDANGKLAGEYFYNDEDDPIPWIRQ